MAHPTLKFVTLLTITSLLVACQSKAADPIPTNTSVDRQAQQTSSSPSTSRKVKTTSPASQASVPASTISSSPAPSQASSSAMAQNQNTPSPRTEASQATPQVTESTTIAAAGPLASQTQDGLVPLPENISTIDSGTDGSESNFWDNVAPDGPITRSIVNMPQDLVGTWYYEDDYYQTTVTITADGAITSDIHVKQGGDFQYSGQMGLLIQEGETLYRLQHGNGEGLTPVVGLGGLGKTALGVELINANLISVRLWGVPLSEDMEAYTYTTTNSSNVWFLVRHQ